MKKVKIKIGMAGITLYDLQDRKNKIIIGLTGNMPFSAIFELLKSIKTLGDEYDDLLLKTKMGNRVLIPRRDVVYSTLISQITDLGNQVTAIANGDYELLASTGFELYSDPSPMPAVTAPEGLTVVDDAVSGGFKVKVKKVEAAMSNIVAWTPDPITPATTWKTRQTGYVTYTITDVTPQTKYWVRVGAVDKNGVVAYCNPVSRTAQ